jgi:hypothetical protein
MDSAVVIAMLGTAALAALALVGQKNGAQPERVAVPVRVSDNEQGVERRPR